MDYVIKISEETAEILLKAYGKFYPPRSEEVGLKTEEKIELALDAIVMNYDAGSDIEQEATAPGKPVTAEELQEEVDRIVNPNLSTDFKQPEPKSLEAVLGAVPELLSIHDLELLAPNNKHIKEAQNSTDPVLRAATQSIFNSVNVSLWDDYPTMDRLIKRAIGFASDKD